VEQNEIDAFYIKFWWKILKLRDSLGYNCADMRKLVQWISKWMGCEVVEKTYST
jgi:hypothetical protein